MQPTESNEPRSIGAEPHADIPTAVKPLNTAPLAATEINTVPQREDREAASLDQSNTSISHAPVRSDTFGVGRLVGAVNRRLIDSFVGYKARINFSRHEDLYQQLSQKLGVLEAQRAYDRVPAYRDFIDARVNWSEISDFSQIPETDKKNYIKPSVDTDRLALYLDGAVPGGTSWDTSTGTSGKPTSWYRGAAEVRQAYQIISHRAQAILGKGSYSFINGFALGPWATGMTAARGVGQDSKSVTYNTGAQPELMLQLIEESRAIDPTRPIVVAGYPPHMEELVQIAREQGVSLHDHQIVAVVGGEAMSELQRDRMRVRGDGGASRDTGFQEVFSFYGASDIDINIGFETPFEVALRKELVGNPELADSLLGKSSPFVPMIFHYDPMTHLIEVNEQQQLLFTEVSGNRISPRIRYNLGDMGALRTMGDVEAALDAHGVDLGVQPLSRLPFVLVWGRIDDGITYRGANFPWENLEETLQLLSLSDQTSGFGLVQYEKDGHVRTDLMLQASTPEHYATLCEDGEELLANALQILRKLNHDFDEQVARVRDNQDIPGLRIYNSDSPMAEHRRENPERKQKHVFLGSDAERALEIESGGRVFRAS